MDPLDLRRAAIERARTDLRVDPAGPGVDPAVVASWRRCATALSSGGHADGAPVEDADEIRARWEASPIRRAVPNLADHLDALATSADLIACVTDPDGRVLWQATPAWLRPRAERVGLRPGGMWHEAVAGTNGIGLALAADRPTTVFATEHWLDPVQEWVCYAAPIHGPDGEIVGAIDLSTTWKHDNALALPTVASLTRVVEHELRLAASGGEVLEAPALDLRVLGEPSATLNGVPLRLTLRQFEILAILGIAGAMTLGELHAHLYGDRPVSMATLKAEISRLRRILGGRLTSRPYRLALPHSLDAVQLLERLERGHVERAARLYSGQLLPASEAPYVADHRHHVDVALRTALLTHGTVAGALRYNATHPYDVEVLERARARSSADDPLVPALAGRIAVAVGA